MNESPAPTVSATCTFGATTCRRAPADVLANAPSPPCVTTTSDGPDRLHSSAISAGATPGCSHARSSSLTLTTSASRTSASTTGSACAGEPMSTGPQVRVVGDGRRRLAAGRPVARRRCRRAAAPSRSSRCARRAGRRRSSSHELRQVPLEVELVGWRRRAASMFAVATGVRVARPVARQHVHVRAAQVPADQVAVRVVAQPGEQVDRPAEPAEADRHVGRAAAGVPLAGAVGADDLVDEGLADDERAVLCCGGHPCSSMSSGAISSASSGRRRGSAGASPARR